jgi:hypothetical protein
MADKRVIFLEDKEKDSLISSRKTSNKPGKPRMILYLRKHGIAKTDRQAYYILLGAAAFCLLISVLIFLIFVLDLRPHRGYVNPNLSPTLKQALPPSLRHK